MGVNNDLFPAESPNLTSDFPIFDFVTSPATSFRKSVMSS